MSWRYFLPLKNKYCYCQTVTNADVVNGYETKTFSMSLLSLEMRQFQTVFIFNTLLQELQEGAAIV